jgi:hypothetical protein
MNPPKCDESDYIFRVYAKAQDGKSRNDYFQAMLKKAKERNFEPSREYSYQSSGDSSRGTSGAFEGIWVHQGVLDGLRRRGRTILGD